MAVVEIIVYRVENADGVGPYDGTDSWFYAACPPWIAWTHDPTPHGDGIPNVETSDLFGFETLEQLFDWFGHALTLRRLEEISQSVVAVTVDGRSRIKRGGCQLTFPRASVRRTAILDWDYIRVERDKYANKMLGIPTETESPNV